MFKILKTEALYYSDITDFSVFDVPLSSFVFYSVSVTSAGISPSPFLYIILYIIYIYLPSTDSKKMRLLHSKYRAMQFILINQYECILTFSLNSL